MATFVFSRLFSFSSPLSFLASLAHTLPYWFFRGLPGGLGDGELAALPRRPLSQCLRSMSPPTSIPITCLGVCFLTSCPPLLQSLFWGNISHHGLMNFRELLNSSSAIVDDSTTHLHFRCRLAYCRFSKCTKWGYFDCRTSYLMGGLSPEMQH